MPGDRDAKRGKSKNRCYKDRSRNDGKGHRPARQHAITDDKGGNRRNPDCKYENLNLPKLPREDGRPFEEIVPAA